MISLEQQEFFMQQALQQAQLASQLKEVPIGAILVQQNQIIAVGHNLTISQLDPTAHAEIVCIRNAAKILKNYRLIDLSLYVTMEPCVMCFGALIQARVKNLVFGASDYRFGALGGLIDLNSYKFNHKINITKNILEPDCKLLIQEFFKSKR
jgi:tRNA(adenine34) deaminase